MRPALQKIIPLWEVPPSKRKYLLPCLDKEGRLNWTRGLSTACDSWQVLCKGSFCCRVLSVGVSMCSATHKQHGEGGGNRHFKIRIKPFRGLPGHVWYGHFPAHPLPCSPSLSTLRPHWPLISSFGHSNFSLSLVPATKQVLRKYRLHVSGAHSLSVDIGLMTVDEKDRLRADVLVAARGRRCCFQLRSARTGRRRGGV